MPRIVAVSVLRQIALAIVRPAADTCELVGSGGRRPGGGHSTLDLHWFIFGEIGPERVHIGLCKPVLLAVAIACFDPSTHGYAPPLPLDATQSRKTSLAASVVEVSSASA